MITIRTIENLLLAAVAYLEGQLILPFCKRNQ